MANFEHRLGLAFAALADPTRRRLLDQLAHEGTRNASQLAQSYTISRQAIVKHLGALCDAGVLHAQRHGNEVRYSVDRAALDEASTWLAEVGHRWDSRLVALGKRLESKRP